MKKFGLVCGSVMMLCGTIVAFAGCGEISQKELVMNNMSEVTYTYFYGKCDDFEVSISSGEREEPYVYDGVSKDKCDFSLVNAKANCNADKIAFVFSINGEAFSSVLEMNTMCGTYMLDLERSLTANDVITVKFKNSQITLDCVSSQFAINYDKAIEIGTGEFSQDITSLTSENELKGECYLKILDNMTNDFDERFWCFSVVDMKGQHLNCLINVETGEIVART